MKPWSSSSMVPASHAVLGTAPMKTNSARVSIDWRSHFTISLVLVPHAAHAARSRSCHRLGPLDLPIKSKRYRHGSVAVPMVSSGGFIAVGLEPAARAPVAVLSRAARIRGGSRRQPAGRSRPAHPRKISVAGAVQLCSHRYGGGQGTKTDRSGSGSPVQLPNARTGDRSGRSALPTTSRSTRGFGGRPSIPRRPRRPPV